jgi:hypothetical protein
MADIFARSDKRMVTGLFPDRTSAETAYQAVTERGYSRDDVNLVMSDDARQRHFGEAAGDETELGTKAASGTGIGGAIGGSLGAIAAAIAALGTSLVVPGLGLVVAGPLAAAIVGAGAGGATGGILGALIGYGIPEERVKHYEEGIRNGGILMGVTPRSDEDALHFQNKWTESRGEHVLGGADINTGMAAGGGAAASTRVDSGVRTVGNDALDTRVGQFESHESAADRGVLNDIGAGMRSSAGNGAMHMQSGAGNMSMQSGANASSSMSSAGNAGKFDPTPGAMAEATLAGGAVAAFDPSADDTYWRNTHQREPYYQANYNYEDYAPAYRLGSSARQHSDQSFEYSEPMLRSQWESVKGSSRLTWEEAKEATRAAWNRIT